MIDNELFQIRHQGKADLEIDAMSLAMSRNMKIKLSNVLFKIES